MAGDLNSAQGYRMLLEELLDWERQYGSSRRVAQEGLFKAHSVDLTDADREQNAFVASLSPDHRALLARMLQEERDSAIEGAQHAAMKWIGIAQDDLKYNGESLIPPRTGEAHDFPVTCGSGPLPHFDDDV